MRGIPAALVAESRSSRPPARAFVAIPSKYGEGVSAKLEDLLPGLLVLTDLGHVVGAKRVDVRGADVVEGRHVGPRGRAPALGVRLLALGARRPALPEHRRVRMGRVLERRR